MLIKIAKNFSAVLVSNVIVLLSSLGLYAIIGRELGATGLGEFSFVLAFIGLFVFLPDFGIGLFIIREIAKDLKLTQIYLGYAIVLVLFLAPISCLIIIFVASRLDISREVFYAISLATIYLILGAFWRLIKAAFYANERMELETIIITIERLMTFILCFIFLWLKYGLISLIIAHVIARSFGLAAGVVVYIKEIKSLPKLMFDRQKSQMLLRKSFPFALNLMATTIYIQADLILLSLWAGEQDTGYYKAATSLVVPLIVLATSLNSAMFPKMTQTSISFPNKTKGLLELSMRYLLVLGWPITLGIIVLAPAIIYLIYGEGFAGSVRALPLLSLIIPLRFISNTLGTGLTAINKQKTRAIVILISAIFNLGLNVFLIPRFTYIGASYSTILTEIIITFVLYYLLSQHLGRLTFQKKFSRIIISGLVMVLVVYGLREMHVLIVVIFSATVYCISLIIFQAFPQEEIIKIKNTTQSWVFSKKF